ncbi:MAG: hypothetical protein QXI33_01590 [Candidatus Pacearchaeota archaeon]
MIINKNRIKKKMALEDTIKKEIFSHASATRELGSVIERVKAGKGPSNSGNYESDIIPYIGIYARDEIQEEIADSLVNNPDTLSQEFRNDIAGMYIAKAHKNARSKLVEKVSSNTNYSSILDELEGKHLYHLILNAPEYKGSDKKFSEAGNLYREMKKWREALEKEDIDAYILSAKNDKMKKLLEKYKGNKEFILGLMAKRTAIKQQGYLSHFIDEKKLDMKGLEKAKSQEEIAEIYGKAIIPDKVKHYLKEATLSAENGERENIYELTGISYLIDQAEKERAKRNKKAKKELEEHEKTS